MHSNIPKVLHCVKHIPMVTRILNVCLTLKPVEIIVLCSPMTYKPVKTQLTKDFRMSETFTKIKYEIQPMSNGTGHAATYAIMNIKDENDVLILSGDSPFITFETLYNMTKTDLPKLLISQKINPFGYGRIILDGSNVIDIVEEKDCTDEQRLIKLVNGGSYFVNRKILKYLLSFLKNNNKQEEYYLTDITSLFIEKMNRQFEGLVCNIKELQNVNTREQLDICNEIVDL